MIANGGGGTHGYHHIEPRRLSNRERARLQTFPDNFIFYDGGPDAGRTAYPRGATASGQCGSPRRCKNSRGRACPSPASAGFDGRGKRDLAKIRREALRLGLPIRIDARERRPRTWKSWMLSGPCASFRCSTPTRRPPIGEHFADVAAILGRRPDPAGHSNGRVGAIRRSLACEYSLETQARARQLWRRLSADLRWGSAGRIESPRSADGRWVIKDLSGLRDGETRSGCTRACD